jgi:mercuric reductase
MRYDLAIIGSGGAAFAAAIAATNKGRSVVMIERSTLGGTCVNTGCVPSKALLAAAEARNVSLAGNFPGIEVTPFGVDLPALIGAKRDLVEALRTVKYAGLAADYGWDLLAGAACFADGPTLEVALTDGGTARVEAEHYLIATGSAAWAPPIDGLADTGYLTSTTAMELDTVPESMIVLGANAVGLEQAQLWCRLGVEVVVVEVLGRAAPFEEPEVSAAISDVFAREGIGVLTGATVTHVGRGAHGYRVRLTETDGRAGELAAEQLLVATGRRPVTTGLNLAAVGVRVGSRGQVVVDEHLRTDNPRIWAAGDVTGAPQFVYVAAAHGTLVADNAFDGAARVIDYTALPRVIFTSPTIAAVGLTHQQAVDAGIDGECRVLPLEYVPRALVNRDTRGLVKIVAERGGGRIRGVSMIAAGAGDAILAAVYAVQSGMTVTQMADTWAPYLTMAEALKLAAQTFTRDVAKLSCCAS